MRLIVQFIFLVLCLFPAAVIAQESQAEDLQKETPSTLRPIELGMTQAEVRERWGSPHTIYLPPIQESDFAKLEDHDWGVHVLGLLSDAFHRKTPENEYDIRVYYALDRRRDPDDPEITVISIEWKPARPLPLLPTLKDLPEVMALCESGCEMWGDKIGPNVMVFPQHPTLRQRRTAEQIAYDWKPVPPEDRDDRRDWSPVADLQLEERVPVAKRRVDQIDWFRRPVERPKIKIDIPRRRLEVDRQMHILFGEVGKMVGPQYLRLGTFPPSAQDESFTQGVK